MINKKEELIKKISREKNILIVQDLDGVCIPLVQDPLKRKINKKYLESAEKLKGKFFVLTCGEHEGRRGVNRLVEEAIKSKTKAKDKGFYLPGLAACGVEYQDRFSNISHPGLKDNEINFLSSVPSKMKSMLSNELDTLLPNIPKEKKISLINVAICDTRFTPTLNFNEIFSYLKDDYEKIKAFQLVMKKIMNNILKESINCGLNNSFFLHLMPNLGTHEGEEIMKKATYSDYGTTDIQFIIKDAIKERGLLVLLNKYIESRTGKAPFGDSFNVRSAPSTHNELTKLCKDKISSEIMPLLIGVGDTVTSVKDQENNLWLRGGSDRGFLTLIQELGKAYKKENQIIFVNSSNEEVSRPKVNGLDMTGISDPNDNLKFNLIINDGPEEYIDWFKLLAERV